MRTSILKARRTRHVKPDRHYLSSVGTKRRLFRGGVFLFCLRFLAQMLRRPREKTLKCTNTNKKAVRYLMRYERTSSNRFPKKRMLEVKHMKRDARILHLSIETSAGLRKNAPSAFRFCRREDEEPYEEEPENRRDDSNYHCLAR